ncbi:sulfate/molybdate ABC transporter ATP-binding protein [Aquabacter spiritensis]|uniref:Sulfate transport system ATP-binding protein n=1 Tax=Aquabacter spiritensis TaxID=933073 RepID=A0A4R3LJX7_9HYPH|nr:sulfate ABC transporter ATP-binding protein [Aquabacter spiritensis]TCT00523.1 sulfate transport system ATP-binding protein [Aquabacter spiritensis]
MTAAVAVENAVKTFGPHRALAGISLDVQPGELVALLGPSGSGKTTLLRVVAGLEGLDAGRVLLDGADATTVPVRHRGIGFVFQHYALFRHMTVGDNIAYGLRSRPRTSRPSEAEIQARVAELLGLIQLDGYGRRFPAQLSGGQRQRVALARALAIEPKVLLLDEPFGALDALVRKELRAWLRALHDQTGHTTLFVTHDQEEALELADRVVVMSQGRIEQVGTPDDVYDRPATPDVFGFMGESSRLEVEVADGLVRVGGQTIAAAADPTPDGPGSLFVRPHDITVSMPGVPGADAVVLGFRRHGSTRLLEVEVGGGRLEASIAPTVRVPNGAKVSVRLDRARLYPRGGGAVDCRPPRAHQAGEYAI